MGYSQNDYYRLITVKNLHSHIILETGSPLLQFHFSTSIKDEMHSNSGLSLFNSGKSYAGLNAFMKQNDDNMRK
ncbi:hypothetical protein IRZ71_01380 [Flavobacterium sp. ANB]|jgi:hypothetical protein|uniref:hypothetical protein n=1 Tax=unclassified Flavobacterium TaxID=196869 RepID=UPI0012B8B058|nr:MULTISPECIES: hypothetical protein [unclassified Flavobacterium]MBF4514974.1 hypothetical protein [Flavobacterium sp. ANB]MTD68300.1 hypothetical protein [Flavobacterium sp. LC2016-13]